jgi:hypothetical protein
MNKVKNYALLIFVVFTLVLAWQYSAMRGKRDAERANKERWQSNYMEATKSMLSNKQIVLQQKEFLKLYADSVKHLTDELKIKPKVITEYSVQTIIQRETDTVIIQVEKIATGTYKIKDSGPCYVWEGLGFIYGLDSLRIEKTGFQYKNKIEHLAYRKVKGRFLFWKTYDKKKVDLFSKPQCGVSFTEVIEVVK